jgi:hypothetical protein
MLRLRHPKYDNLGSKKAREVDIMRLIKSLKIREYVGFREAHKSQPKVEE